MPHRSTRRLLAIPCAVAAIVPSVILLNRTPSAPLSDGVAGLIVGGLLGISIGVLMKYRSRCVSR